MNSLTWGERIVSHMKIGSETKVYIYVASSKHEYVSEEER